MADNNKKSYEDSKSLGVKNYLPSEIENHKRLEHQLKKLNKMLMAISRSSKAMMQASDEISYTQEVCKIIVEVCGYAMVWIGLAEDDENKTVRPIAYSGFEQGYLESLNITWVDSERGRGPTGTAIRTGKIVSCKNMLSDPKFAPWREQAIKNGYSSSIVFPLISNGKSFGALSIYSSEVDPFIEEEVKILNELAEDLSYGIETIRLRNQSILAQQALKKSERQVRSKLDSLLSPEGNLGDIELADILDIDSVESIMQNFYHLTKIPMAIIDLKGEVLIGIGWQDICTKFHRIHPDTCGFCIESDTQLTKDISPGETRLYKCKNNMWDVATPIIVNNQHLGNIFTGQFFFEDEPLDQDVFLIQAKKYKFNEVEYLDALKQVPRFNRQKLAEGMQFLAKLAEMISKLSYSNIKLAKSIAQNNDLIASLKQSEDSLSRYKLLSEYSRDMIFFVKPDGKIIEANASAASYYGYTQDELLQLSIYDLRASETINQIPSQLSQANESNILFETFHKRKDGTVFPVEVSSSGTDMFGERILMSIVRDITDRKNSEQALLASEEEYRQRAEEVETIMNLAPVAIWVAHDASCNDITGNKVAEQFYEAMEGENVSAGTTDVRRFFRGGTELTPEELPMQYAAAHNVDVKDSELEVLLPSGEWRIIWGYATPLRDAQGEVRGCVGAFIDITQRKKQELELALSRADAERRAEELNTVIDAVPVAVWIAHNTDASEITGNKVSAEILKIPRDANMSMTAAEDVRPRTFELFKDGRKLEPQEMPVQQAACGNSIYNYEFDLVLDDGNIRHMLGNAIPLYDAEDKPRGSVAAFMDVTERKIFENQQKDLLEREHHIAEVLQKSLIPPSLPETVHGCGLAAIYKPALKEAEVGGDFYDVFELGHGKIGLLIGDVAGKGLQASSRVASAIHTIYAYAKLEYDPVNVIALTNEVLCRAEYDENCMLTVFFAILDTKARTITYTCAGHEPPIIISVKNDFQYLEISGMPLGIMKGISFSQTTKELNIGDLLVLYTDGISEARTSGKNLFGINRIKEYIKNHRWLSENEIASGLLEESTAFAGGSLQDDAAIVVISLDCAMKGNNNG